ncbi:potassium transporter KtrB [bacterium]|nr:potassium transporter KtrB [bacterium]
MKLYTEITLFIKNLHPVKIVFFGYILYIIFGWIFLNLPISHTVPVAALDNLFVATSAVSTTGLSTIDISGSYTFFGQLVIIILIQLGGIGYMTFGSFVILSRKKPLDSSREEVSKTVFSLPKHLRIDKFIKSVIIFTAIIEILGAVCLYFVFRSAGVPQPLWSAVFHSISSFCTAGFSLYSSSFELFCNNFWLNFIVSILSYAGAIGFIVFVDVWRTVRGKTAQITLTSKIIIHTTFWISIVGTFILFITEPSIQCMPSQYRLMASFFQAMTAMTTVGFNTIPISGIARASLLLITVLMVIGASPSGTGGGLKSTTFSAIIGIMKSTLKGSARITFWGYEIPFERVLTAIASLCFYITILVTGTFLLTLTEKSSFQCILFEAASALGTVGLSMGLTSALTTLGKLIVTLLMFIGRLGPLTFGIALFLSKKPLFNSDDIDMAV